MRRRRLTPTYQITIAAVLLWLLAIAGISQANAAQLTVNTMSPGAVFAIGRCADGLTAIPEDRRGSSQNYGEVEISDIPASCNGLPLAYFLLDDDGVMVNGTGTATTGVMTFAVSGNYKAEDVETALVFIGTWPIPTTWSMEPPPAPPAVLCEVLTPWVPGEGGNPWWPPPATYGEPTGELCDVTITRHDPYWADGRDEGYWLGFSINIEDQPNSIENWRVTFDFSNTDEFSGWTPTYVGISSGQNPVQATDYSCTQLPIFSVQAYLPHEATSGEIGYNRTGDQWGTPVCSP